MSKKHLGPAVLLLTAAVFISGCGEKPAGQSAAVNNAVTNQNQNQVQTQNQVNNQAPVTVNPSGEYTINELLTMNKPLKCSWKQSANSKSDVTNIIYINGNMFYQDVTMGDIGHAYTISDGDYLYNWNDFTGAATKIKNTEAKSDTISGQKKADTAGKEQKYDFVCESWAVDSSVFIPPAGKDFKDVTEEMTQAVQGLQGEGLEKSKQLVCDLCKKAPTQEAIDDCLKNAECSQ